MNVLALDTSSAAVTAAVVSVGSASAVLAGHVELAARGHGELLAPAIEASLREAGIGPRELAAVVVGAGPGPFTGLRVGLVTAAVMSDVLGVAAYAVCSLDAIAAAGSAASAAPGELLVAADARRKEVYWARYDASGHRVAGPEVSRPADVPLEGVTAIAGAGAELYADVWPQLTRLPSAFPDPAAMVALARDRIEAAAPSDPLTPLYLRRPDAVVPGAPKPVHT